MGVDDGRAGVTGTYVARCSPETVQPCSSSPGILPFWRPMKRNSLRNRPTPTAPAASAPGASSGISMLASSSIFWPSSVTAGVWRSRDGGATWTIVSGNLPADTHTLAFLPTDDKVVFATTRTGLFKSIDQGRIWSRCMGGLPASDITGLALHPLGRTIFASDFTYGGVFRSDDAGSPLGGPLVPVGADGTVDSLLDDAEGDEFVRGAMAS